MVDKVEATKNLKRYNAELDKWLVLERSLMTFDEMQTVDRKIETLKAWIKNCGSGFHRERILLDSYFYKVMLFMKVKELMLNYKNQFRA